MVRNTRGSKGKSQWGFVRFSSQPYSYKKGFFSKFQWQTKKDGELTRPRQTNSNYSKLGQLGQHIGHTKKLVLMLLDSTVGNILGKTHKPAKATEYHKIIKLSSWMWWIRMLRTLEILYPVFGCEKKAHIFKHVLLRKGDVQTQVTPQYMVRKLIWI